MTGGTWNLETLLGVHIFALIMIFSRVGSCFMMFPGIGENTVPPRMRLLLAMAICFAMLPTVEPVLPVQPQNVPGLVNLIFGEVLVGIFFGVVIRCLMAALDTAGMMISLQLGINNAAIFNPEMAVQDTLPATMLGLAALMLVFMTNTHHIMLRGLVGSYDTFKPGHTFMMLDYSNSMAMIVSKSFNIGIEIAAPFIIIGTCFHVVMGLIARMLPQLQIFFLALPMQIMGGLLAFAATFSALMMYWLNQIPDFIPGFFLPGQ